MVPVDVHTVGVAAGVGGAAVGVGGRDDEHLGALQEASRPAVLGVGEVADGGRTHRLAAGGLVAVLGADQQQDVAARRFVRVGWCGRGADPHQPQRPPLRGGADPVDGHARGGRVDGREEVRLLGLGGPLSPWLISNPVRGGRCSARAGALRNDPVSSAPIAPQAALRKSGDRENTKDLLG
ncbi:hypothetical protein SANTM175S_00635 [Streptomyces antimycoticus]